MLERLATTPLIPISESRITALMNPITRMTFVAVEFFMLTTIPHFACGVIAAALFDYETRTLRPADEVHVPRPPTDLFAARVPHLRPVAELVAARVHPLRTLVVEV